MTTCFSTLFILPAAAGLQPVVLQQWFSTAPERQVGIAPHCCVSSPTAKRFRVGRYQTFDSRLKTFDSPPHCCVLSPTAGRLRVIRGQTFGSRLKTFDSPPPLPLRFTLHYTRSSGEAVFYNQLICLLWFSLTGKGNHQIISVVTR